MQLKEGILWITNFICIIAWAIVGQLHSVQNSEQKQKFVRYLFSTVDLVLFTCFYFVLGLTWKAMIVLFLISTTPTIFSELLHGNWRRLIKGKFNQLNIICSWFSRSVLFLVLAVLLRSSIWLIGATIIFIAGIVNIYFELVIKDAIKYLNPKVKDSYRLSGFTLTDEYLAVIATMSTSFLYFPLLYFLPDFSKVLQNILVNSHINTLILVFVFLLFGVVVVMVLVPPNQEREKELQPILAKVIRGLIIMVPKNWTGY